MAGKGYEAEYVPPQDNCAILQGLFEKVRGRIAKTLPEGIINHAPLKVEKERNYYR